MKLKVVLPSAVFLEREVIKVVAEARNGSFCLLPRHVDFVAPLVPGILSLTAPTGEESFLAVDEGILLKCADDVLVSTRNAARGSLGELKRAVQKEFHELGEREQKGRIALGKLEASLVRQILRWEERNHAGTAERRSPLGSSS